MEIGFVLALVVVAVVILSTEWLPMEVFSLLLIGVLVLSRVITAEQAFMGFGSSTVIMIAGVMVLTGALMHNGAADILARRIEGLGGANERRTGCFLIGAVNGASSVINNVAATAVFIPVAEAMARRFGRSRKRYLMPVAFASMTGGMCTLIGTSTNVAVSGAMAQHGLAPLGFFELTPVGVLVALAGGVYLLFLAPKLIDRLESVGPGEFETKEFLYEIRVHEGAFLAGKTLEQANLGHRFGVEVLAIARGERRIDTPDGDQEIRPADLLLVKGEARRIARVRSLPGLEIKSMPVDELEGEGARLAEVTVSYNSPLIGKTLKEHNFRQSYGVSVLAIHRREEDMVEKVGKIPLKAGDVLLAFGREEQFLRLARMPASLLVETLVLPRHDARIALRAFLILLAAILASSLGLVDAPTSFLSGAGLVMALGCLSAKEAGSYLNVRFLVMLAAMSALGLAMETSGAAAFLADQATNLIGPDHPWLLMTAFFALTVVLTQPLSNAAAALLVLPVAVHAAHSIGVDPRAFAITITVAASCSFITPFEPACLLVYGTGHYRFLDFLKVGCGLTVLVGGLSLLVIPLLWPLHP